MNIISSSDKDLPEDFQNIAKEAARICIDAIEGAAAHAGDPARFPIAAKAKLEHAALDVLKLREGFKPRQFRALQLRAAAKFTKPAAVAANATLVSRLRAQPSFAARGILAELQAMPLAAKAMPLSPTTITAVKSAVANKSVETLLQSLGLSFSIFPGQIGVPVVPAQPVGSTKLRLNIDRVKCIDDVGLELTDFRKDDIRLGGLGVDSTGQQREVAGFKVGDFNTGDSKTFNPNRKFVEFDLTVPGTWPRAFSSTFLMAESDGSGAFLDALRKLWAAVGEVVEDLVVAAVIAGAGAIGIAVGAAGGPVGMIIGAVVGAAIGLIVNFLFNSLEDDVFEPTTVTLLLPEITTLFPGAKRKSGKVVEQLTHPDAQYTLKYEWELVA
jgi:hypothetical protein